MTFPIDPTLPTQVDSGGLSSSPSRPHCDPGHEVSTVPGQSGETVASVRGHTDDRSARRDLDGNSVSINGRYYTNYCVISKPSETHLPQAAQRPANLANNRGARSDQAEHRLYHLITVYRLFLIGNVLRADYRILEKYNEREKK